MGQNPAVVAKESFDFWQSKGAPLWVVWSLLGNEQRETSFDWTQTGDKLSGGAHGVCQWHDARIKQILQHTGIDVRSAGHLQQLEAWFREMSEPWGAPYGKVWASLLATHSEYMACYVLVHDYERAAKTDRDVGIQVGFAQSLAASNAGWLVPPLAEE